jgi:hypothetical protein
MISTQHPNRQSSEPVLPTSAVRSRSHPPTSPTGGLEQGILQQPIAVQVYERIQGLRREAYDSSDYLEGLNAFAEKRPPIFRGT